MRLKIILFSLLLIVTVKSKDNHTQSAGSEGDDGSRKTITSPVKDIKTEKRPEVEVLPPELDVNVPAVLTQSKGVPRFDAYDSFTTIYPMRCGGAVKAAPNLEEVARCMPDTNDIVEILKDDSLHAEYCIRVLICKPGEGNQMCDPSSIKLWFPYGRKLVQADSVKDYDKTELKVVKGEILTNIDPGCQLMLNYEHALRHRFLNKPPKIREIMKKYPGFYLQPTFYHPRRLYKGGNTVFLGESLHLGSNILKQIECNAECDLGQLFFFKMEPNSAFYSKIFVDGSVCEWFKVCLTGRPGFISEKFYCRDADMLNVYVKNGFVVMPGAMNGATIRLVKSTRSGLGFDKFKKRPTQIGFDYDGERFSIWSVGRERVASSSSVNHDGHLILYFSDHQCLVKNYGIMYLGENNGIVYQIDKNKDIDQVSRGKGAFVVYPTAPPRPALPTIATEKPTPNISAAAPVTTTIVRVVGNLIGGGSAPAIHRARTGWLIWGMFYGFFVGCSIAVIIGGTIMYFCRRSFYSDWYRGMYKRYGCDASGVTGGVTGSLFGSTTTGGTVGGTTMGDTTGLGTTGGTTGSAAEGTTSSTGGGTTTSKGGGGGDSMGPTGETGGTAGGATGGAAGGTSGDMVTM